MSDRIARLLAHPLRDRVLFEYQGDPACPSEVARRIGRPLNLVSYHTGVLLRHGCVELVKAERRRGAQVSYYRATVAQFIEDRSWVGLSVARRRQLALNSLAGIAAEARNGALAGAFDAPHAHMSRSPVELDDEGVEAVSRLMRRTFAELAEIAEASHRRSHAARREQLVVLAFAESRPELRAQPQSRQIGSPASASATAER